MTNIKFLLIKFNTSYLLAKMGRTNHSSSDNNGAPEGMDVDTAVHLET